MVLFTTDGFGLCAFILSSSLRGGGKKGIFVVTMATQEERGLQVFGTESVLSDPDEKKVVSVQRIQEALWCC